MSEVQQRDPSHSRGEIEQLGSFLEAVPSAALLLDGAGRVRFINRLAEDFLARSGDDFVGKELLCEIVAGSEAGSLTAEYRALVQQPDPAEARWNTTILVSSDPRPVCLALRFHQGAADRWGILLLHDRSALTAETERRRKAERLAAVGEVAAGVAHEVNNPLASIKGFAQLLARETLDRGQHQALEIIGHECNRIAGVIDNLLDFSSQQEIVEREVVDVSSAVETIVNLKRYALETSGIEIESDFDPHVSPMYGEKGALQRLTLILLQHAERSLARQNGEKRLVVRTRETNQGAAIYVSDTGPGVPPEHLSFLLGSEAYDDAGLSLTSADSIARELGGSFWIESGEGRGTTTGRCIRCLLWPSPPNDELVANSLLAIPALYGKLTFQIHRSYG